MSKKLEQSLDKRIKLLNEIGVSLSRETNKEKVLEKIVEGAMYLTNADGGSLYLLKGQQAQFSIVKNKSLGVNIRGAENLTDIFMPIPLYHKKGKPNYSNVIAASLLENKTINIRNAYRNTKYDLSGTKAFDKKTNYHSRAFLTVPLIDHDGVILGGFQLINPINPRTKKVTFFSLSDQKIVESLASQVAIILTQKKLLQEQKELFEAVVQLIAKTIDEKSIYTSGHCRRVPLITLMLADAAEQMKQGPLKKFSLTDEQREELRIAAWMHDCGKLSTPEAVMDKATKLQKIFDRIALLEARYEILRRDLHIQYLQKQIDQNEYQKKQERLKEELDLIKQSNIGGEAMTPEDLQRLKSIATSYRWQDAAEQSQPWISDEELQNLSILRGTLNDQERQIISNHVSVTLKMLAVLPWPKYLKNLPEIAGSHHEKVNGTGYPRRLTGKQMSVQAKIIAIADVFEALTAADRPYKKAKPLSEVMKIMYAMKKEGHIDPDLFDVFIRSKIYLTYAKEFLPKEQINAVDEAAILS
jgi:HD-GYP domain-containing protein (c-di-GMP phosphodiesterase class II)